jgi:superfamily I DNA and/or RNA helicase
VKNCFKFNLCRYNEAAQALEAELVVAFARRPRRCLLVGDPAQLPATMASDVARRAGHDRSLMQRLLDSADSWLSGWFTLLDTQYRMHPAISSFPSQRFYAGGLKDAPCVKTTAIPITIPSSRSVQGAVPGWIRAPFVFVDVASGREERGGGGGGGGGASIGNPAEAELAAVLAALLPSIMPPTSAATAAATAAASTSRASSAAPASAVITFYSEQVRRVQRELAHNKFAAAEPGVHSVDSFQGSEADVVVVSAVRCNPGADVVGLYKLNPVVTHSLKAPGFNP